METDADAQIPQDMYEDKMEKYIYMRNKGRIKTDNIGA